MKNRAAITFICFGLLTVQTVMAGGGVINVLDHGAVANGTALNTAAFGKAVAACVKQKGGTILVPAGISTCGRPLSRSGRSSGMSWPGYFATERTD